MRKTHAVKEVYRSVAVGGPEEMKTLCGENNRNLTKIAQKTGARVTRLDDHQIVLQGKPQDVGNASIILKRQLL